jgi:hypothetical protein
MAKRKKVDAPIVEYKDGEEKLTIFGWCLTGHHKGCIVRFPGHKCPCECHRGKKSDATTRDGSD